MAIDWKKPIETREGYPARILSENLDNSKYPVCVAFIDGTDLEEYVESVTIDGKVSIDYGVPFIRNKKQKVWINLYRNKEGYNFGKWHWHHTKEEADENAFVDRFACVEVEI